MQMDPIAVRVSELPALTGLKRSTLYPKLMDGSIPSFKVGAARLVLREDVERWLRGQRDASIGEAQ
jgi:excisionase family DNA binding protein